MVTKVVTHRPGPVGDNEESGIEHYPVASDVCPSPSEKDTLNSTFNHRAQEQFRESLRGTHPGIVARLEQPFGKDNLKQTFVSSAAFRHVLIPLWKSGFMADWVDDWDNLCEACVPARLLVALLRDYGDTEFHGIRGYNPDWAKETAVNQDRVAMATAALIHFDGNVADLVRWTGGPHVAAHLDHDACTCAGGE